MSPLFFLLPTRKGNEESSIYPFKIFDFNKAHTVVFYAQKAPPGVCGASLRIGNKVVKIEDFKRVLLAEPSSLVCVPWLRVGKQVVIVCAFKRRIGKHVPPSSQQIEDYRAFKAFYLHIV